MKLKKTSFNICSIGFIGDSLVMIFDYNDRLQVLNTKSLYLFTQANDMSSLYKYILEMRTDRKQVGSQIYLTDYLDNQQQRKEREKQ